MTTYMFRLWAGPGMVREVARRCAAAGLRVYICGTEHVYLLQDSDIDRDEAADCIRRALPRYGDNPMYWATLSVEDATFLRQSPPPDI
jgi:hypothetical protein